ncbi:MULTISPECIES: hypothetical protein [Aerococcus]|uniref:hypothetical protein n=1 Tax=Aerococcus urinae (strain CCUG 59500 / ACS-120-V-Col10a) TaxID=2976812 RepID=UPI000200F3DB|nr:hypothetical protein [Aerococcus sp. Group 1]AEA00677.1 hypothetical protein HMPREF9243_1933 [Aerococcus sp. Group 1]MCY3030336.1 hypothetical protein [Aerococcus sp. Group 1]MCY3055433.1 hypothetical protein [Aerococcus sp. Group 1]MCY3057163.1 hypothetical protein [Aerococcus sp. Group 1]MCY3061525.1 hypothetical protein [Aerococcus sp. Group 1]
MKSIFIIQQTTFLVASLLGIFMNWRAKQRKKQIQAAETTTQEPIIQKAPKRILIIAYFLMGLAVILLIMTGLLTFAEQEVDKLAFIIFSVLSSVFWITGIYLYMVDRHYLYAEDDEKFLVKTIGKQVLIYYEEILTYQIKYDQLIITNRQGQQAAVALHLFAPVKLIRVILSQLDDEIDRLRLLNEDIPDNLLVYQDWLRQYLD